MPLTKNVWGFFLKTIKTIITDVFLLCPVPWSRNSLPKEERVRPRFVAFWWSSMHCTMTIAVVWHLICCFCFPLKRVSLPCIFRQGKVLLAMRSCDAICHIWSWSCFGTHRPLFPDHILQDQGSPRSKTLSITNLRSGADISLADKSNPIWSKLTALHRFLCEFSLVWWGVRAAKTWQNLEAEARTAF